MVVLEELKSEDTLAFKPCGAGDARGERGGDTAAAAVAVVREGCGDGDAAKFDLDVAADSAIGLSAVGVVCSCTWRKI